MDTNSRETWEISREELAAFPTYSDLLSFLERRLQSLEQVQTSLEPVEHPSQQARNRGSGQRRVLANNTQIAESSDSRAIPVCDLCQAGHWLYRCHKFIAMTQQQRFDLCKHHTKLYRSSNTEERHDDRVDSALGDHELRMVNAHATTTDAEVLLATAMILVVAADGRALPVRALIDPCSGSTFITWRIAQQLNLKITCIQPLNVVGLGTATSARAHSVMHCRVKSAQ
uniref:Peptidase aspartic putative domain-containing protein n=1 Tax=Trichogramma kaykai TaxID=54128 RepID=A0ABD2WIH6_9HYME